MSDLITNQTLTQELERLIPSCSKLIVISAFITQPAVAWLCDLVLDLNIEIQIVGRLSPKDLLLGASDFSAVKMCLDQGFKICTLENLHAKIFQIDNDYIFNGSANLTGKGLALVSNVNLECCNSVEPSVENISFIQKIINASTPIDFDILYSMMDFVEFYNDSELQSIPSVWPSDIIEIRTFLFFSDFPLSRPNSTAEEYVLNPDLTFAKFESMKGDLKSLSKFFKDSRAYVWLKSCILNNANSNDVNFGKLSNLLHNALADEPLPYRKDVKIILSNLLEYVSIYATDELRVHVPGARSQVVSLVK